jgi:hypothetical protein
VEADVDMEDEMDAAAAKEATTAEIVAARPHTAGPMATALT